MTELAGRPKISIAPMMDWTDRHCRYFMRLLSPSALLYTEMVTAAAVVHGDADRFLRFNEEEHPVALQLGGSDPGRLAEAARIGADFGYDEINLNVGCPSDRVQSGTFGACLMREPLLVGACTQAMKRVVGIPVTVKCRIGVDDQDPETALADLAAAVLGAGADALWVHARKAWLQGLSPKQNREIPPLDYGRVYRLKQDHPEAFVGINGGVLSLEQALAHLDHVDGVMMGRAAYRTPAILAGADRAVLARTERPACLVAAVERMIPYVERHLAAGGRLSAVTRHMIGLFQGRPGARRWRQVLTVDGSRPGAGARVIEDALQAVRAAGGLAEDAAAVEAA